MSTLTGTYGYCGWLRNLVSVGCGLSLLVSGCAQQRPLLVDPAPGAAQLHPQAPSAPPSRVSVPEQVPEVFAPHTLDDHVRLALLAPGAEEQRQPREEGIHLGAPALGSGAALPRRKASVSANPELDEQFMMLEPPRVAANDHPQAPPPPKPTAVPPPAGEAPAKVRPPMPMGVDSRLVQLDLDHSKVPPLSKIKTHNLDLQPLAAAYDEYGTVDLKPSFLAPPPEPVVVSREAGPVMEVPASYRNRIRYRGADRGTGRPLVEPIEPPSPTPTATPEPKPPGSRFHVGQESSDWNDRFVQAMDAHAQGDTVGCQQQLERIKLDTRSESGLAQVEFWLAECAWINEDFLRATSGYRRVLDSPDQTWDTEAGYKLAMCEMLMKDLQP